MYRKLETTVLISFSGRGFDRSKNVKENFDNHTANMMKTCSELVIGIYTTKNKTTDGRVE